MRYCNFSAGNFFLLGTDFFSNVLMLRSYFRIVIDDIVKIDF